MRFPTGASIFLPSLLLSASLRAWSSSISIQILLTSSWLKQITFQKVCGKTRSSFFSWHKSDNKGFWGEKEGGETVFSNRRFGDTERRSDTRRGRDGDGKGRTRARPGERKNERAHRIHYRVNYPQAHGNISTNTSISRHWLCFYLCQITAHCSLRWRRHVVASGRARPVRGQAWTPRRPAHPRLSARPPVPTICSKWTRKTNSGVRGARL